MSVQLDADLCGQMLAHAYACHPEESCGLLAGPRPSDIRRVFPTTNVLHSATNYTIDPTEHMHAIREAEKNGWEIVGVFHSHPHTKGFPSVTDVTLAPDPTWLYVIIGMEQRDEPTVQAYRIVDGEITEEVLDVQENIT
jgi:proteasome lid subunit RPN8/RPN11